MTFKISSGAVTSAATVSNCKFAGLEASPYGFESALDEILAAIRVHLREKFQACQRSALELERAPIESDAAEGRLSTEDNAAILDDGAGGKLLVIETDGLTLKFNWNSHNDPIAQFWARDPGSCIEALPPSRDPKKGAL